MPQGRPPRFPGPFVRQTPMGSPFNFGRIAQQAPTRSSAGGLFANLFGKGGQGAAGAGSITNFMSGTQKVIKAGNTIVPMVKQAQQYGPLIKNLPAMWKMYRELGSEEETTEESSHEKVKETTSANKRPKHDHDEVTAEESILKEKGPKPSLPKLFI